MNTKDVTLSDQKSDTNKKSGTDRKHLLSLAYWTSIHRNRMCNGRLKIKGHNPKHFELPHSSSPTKQYNMQSTISQICKYRADSEITSPRQEHYISLAIETSHRETSPQRSTPTGIQFPN